MKFDRVTRVEVIDNDGRRYVKYNVNDVELMLQDDDGDEMFEIPLEARDVLAHLREFFDE